MQDILMEINNLSYRYEDGTLALDQVSLQIRRHERLAIMGSNGSGKSTLLLNLNGVYRPTGGQILYEGRPVDYSRKGLLELRRQVGIVFQDPDNQLFCASVAGEISFGLYNLGLDEEEIRRRVDAVCQKLSIDPFRDKPTHFLSGGQKKRVSIADILVMRPSLLILDEPFSALDPKHAQMIDEILSQLAREGITVARQTLTLFVWVQILVGQPSNPNLYRLGFVLSRGIAQFGSVLGSGPRGRGFKSRYSDQKGGR